MPDLVCYIKLGATVYIEKIEDGVTTEMIGSIHTSTCPLDMESLPPARVVDQHYQAETRFGILHVLTECSSRNSVDSMSTRICDCDQATIHIFMRIP